MQIKVNIAWIKAIQIIVYLLLVLFLAYGLIWIFDHHSGGWMFFGFILGPYMLGLLVGLLISLIKFITFTIKGKFSLVKNIFLLLPVILSAYWVFPHTEDILNQAGMNLYLANIEKSINLKGETSSLGAIALNGKLSSNDNSDKILYLSESVIRIGKSNFLLELANLGRGNMISLVPDINGIDRGCITYNNENNITTKLSPIKSEKGKYFAIKTGFYETDTTYRLFSEDLKLLATDNLDIFSIPITLSIADSSSRYSQKNIDLYIKESDMWNMLYGVLTKYPECINIGFTPE
ncbi:hypothetical protein K2X92_01785 [Candidatus Gracilibacteria bacterium]|nr:hypothetical protein [Candidatus Gracilibacteria bacterium]